MGRRTYTDEDKARVLAWMQETGRGVKAAAKAFGFPVSSVRRWRSEGSELRSDPGSVLDIGPPSDPSDPGSVEAIGPQGVQQTSDPQLDTPNAPDPKFDAFDHELETRTGPPDEGFLRDNMRVDPRDLPPTPAQLLDRLTGEEPDFDAVSERYGEVVGHVLADTVLPSEPTQEDKDAVKLALASVLEDTVRLNVLVQIEARQEHLVAARLARVGAVHGLKGPSDQLAKAVKKQADKARKQLARKARQDAMRLAEPGEQDVISELWTPEGVPRLAMPAGYACRSGNLVRLVMKMGETGQPEETPVPVMDMVPLITKVYDGATDEVAHFQLEWKWDGRDFRLVVPRRTCREARQITCLADHFFDVHSGNAKDTVDFLARFERTNRGAIPRGRMSARFGWLDDETFVLGDRVLSDGEVDTDIQFHANGPEEELFTRAFATEGTWEGWVAALEPIRGFPVVYTAIYASLAAVFLLPLRAKNFVVDWSSGPGTGKTTSLTLASSCWGPVERSRSVVRSWSLTPTKFERHAELMCDLPTMLDDTNHIAKRDRPTIAQRIYDFANGRGKGRAKLQGSRRSATWRGILLSTGESPAVGYTQDGGSAGRTITLREPPMRSGDQSADGARAEALVRALDDHHGHAGERMVRWLLGRRAEWGTLRKALHRRTSELRAKGVASSTDNRQMEHVALLSIVADVLHERLGVPRPTVDVIEYLREAVVQGARDNDRPTAALRVAYELAVRRPRDFFGAKGSDVKSSPPHGGWLGLWDRRDGDWKELCFLPTVLDRELELHGFEAKSMVEAWRARGWAVSGEGRHANPKRSVGRSRVRVVAITRQAVDGLV